ncbi:uncharacterized protein LOC131145747 [Malania oleifera]|uniref:uncharacterized protein LOC131145747 n=1 Tax=Malania oleifera TaxID=397392 RepID=UPI0025AE3526|nr:uncharacterized protein LOC131145747 [Malania oleifera]
MVVLGCWGCVAGVWRCGRVAGGPLVWLAGARESQRSISIALTVKNKIACIDGTLPQPNLSDSRTQIAWLRANNLVLSWLVNSIAKEICGSLLYLTSAYDIWEELKTRYLRSDGPRLQANSQLQMWNSQPVFLQFLKNFLDRQQSDFVMKFLIGLHDSYSMMRSQLLLQSPLPSMSKVFSLLLQEESQRSLSNAVGISIDSHAMNAAQTQRFVATSGIRFTKPKMKGNVTCSHCGYNGHLADKCFHLIGYPPGWKGS